MPNDLRRVLVVPVCWIAKFSIMLRVGLRQRTRPAPLRDVISIYQRLKSGAEFDQFGVKGLRGRSRCCGGHRQAAIVLMNARRVGDVLVGGVLCTRVAWVMGLSPFMVRVRAGAEVHTCPSACFCASAK
jgi:hypothetical protein